MSDDMDPRVHISWDRNGGRVVTYGPNGVGAASLLVADGKWRGDNTRREGENGCLSHGE